MRALILLAHPEPRSFNEHLAAQAAEQLRHDALQVDVVDLYAEGFDPLEAAEHHPHRLHPGHFDAQREQRHSAEQGQLPVDVQHHLQLLRAADLLILQFPLWWFSMPAILKGWFERVYAYGFAYGVGEHSDTHWGDRYGEGTLAGKRAMLIVTAGGWESHYAPRGINGPIDDILFPIQHGMLHYPGFEVLPPFVTYRAGKTDEARFAALCEQLGQRLDNLWNAEPIRFRRQNAGDYLIPQLTLKAHLAPGQDGFSIHLK